MRTTDFSGEAKRESVTVRARRAQIAEAAAEVVAEVGYANASMARIAERANISKGVITYHFDSKDEIMRLVAIQLFDRAAEHIEEQIGTATSAAAQVQAWIGAEMEFFTAHRTEFLAMNEIMANHRDSNFSRAFEAEAAEETRRLARILAHGQRAEEFRPFDTQRVASIILRCKDSVLDAWAQGPELDLGAQTETLLDFIDHAIGARGHSTT